LKILATWWLDMDEWIGNASALTAVVASFVDVVAV